MKLLAVRTPGLRAAIGLVLGLIVYGSLYPFQWNFAAPQDFIWSGRIGLMDLMVLGGMVKSKGEARRLITQGGVSLNDEKVSDVYATVSKADLEAGAVVRKGKKVFRKFTL